MAKVTDNRDDRPFDSTQCDAEMTRSTGDKFYFMQYGIWSFVRNHVTPDDDLLDVGCGIYQSLRKVLRHGFSAKIDTYTGVDVQPLEDCGGYRDKFIGNFDFTKRYSELGKYDVICMLEFLEHLHVDLGYKSLKAAHTLLRKDGRLLLSGPVYDGVGQFDNHVHEYTNGELHGRLRSAGFKVKATFGTRVDVRHIRNSDEHDLHWVYDELSKYYDNEALSVIFAPLFPEYAKGCAWLCVKE